MKINNIQNQTVFLRVDFNAPIENQIISDTKRIDDSILTIEKIIKNNNKLVIASHFGRPKGFDLQLSLKPIYDYLQTKLLNYKIHFVENIDHNLSKFIANTNFGEIIFLENLRFYPGEENGDKDFMQLLSTNVDIYCNEAFSCSHRSHASIMMGELFDSDNRFFGDLFNKEITAIDSFILNVEKPSFAIIGGSKISSKISLIEQLKEKIDYLFIGGAMANTILKHQGYQVGKSLVENNCNEIINQIVSNDSLCKIILPVDVIVTDSIKEPTYIIEKNIDEIGVNDIIVDIGSKTIENVFTIIEKCKNILWNGPVGLFEIKPFDNGTNLIGKKIAEKTNGGGIKSIIGGGDTLSAIKNLNIIEDFTHASTAGGAFLEYIEKNGKLPGISPLTMK